MPELAGPPMPNGVEHLVKWFNEIAESRTIGYSGPLTIPASEIVAWQNLSGITLTRWERRIIRKIDNLYISTYYGSR